MNYLKNTIPLIITLLSGIVLNAQNMEKSISEIIQPYAYTTNAVQIDDSTSVAYVSVGEGEKTLLLLHGLGTYIPSWNLIIEELKSTYRCVAIDLPGYGRSSKGNYPSTMNYYSNAVKKVIEELQLQNVTLVGHSMGGHIAITTVLNYPDIAQSLVLLAPAGFETFSEQNRQVFKVAYTEKSITDVTEEQLRANWALNFFSMPKEVEFMIQDRLNMAMANDFDKYASGLVKGVFGMLDAPVKERLADITIKTLVVYGENDQLIPNKYMNPNLTTKMVGESGAKLIPKAELHFIPECGHLLPFEKPTEIAEILKSFL